MKGLNLSEWAVNHRPLTLFLILLVSFCGVWSYTHLGRAEHPELTVKVMIIAAAWPGATADEVQRLAMGEDAVDGRISYLPSLNALAVEGVMDAPGDRGPQRNDRPEQQCGPASSRHRPQIYGAEGVCRRTLAPRRGVDR